MCSPQRRGVAVAILAFLCFCRLPLPAAGSAGCVSTAASTDPKVFKYAGHCRACRDLTIDYFVGDDEACESACQADPECDSYAVHDIESPTECELFRQCNSFLEDADCLDSSFYTCSENCPPESETFWTVRSRFVCDSGCMIKEIEDVTQVQACAEACKDEPGCGQYVLNADAECTLYKPDCACYFDDGESLAFKGLLRTLAPAAAVAFTPDSECVTVMEGWSYKPKPGSESFYAKHPDRETAFANCQDAHVIVTNQETGSSFCWKYVEGYYVENEVVGASDICYDTYNCQKIATA